MIAGFDAPDAGDILLDGRRVNEVPAAASARLGIVFQDYAVFSRLTVRQQPRIRTGSARGWRGQQRAPAVEQMAHRLGLTDLLDCRGDSTQRERAAAGRTRPPHFVTQPRTVPAGRAHGHR